MSLDAPPKTLLLRPTPDSHLIVDHLRGPTPTYVYLHGFTSDRTGQKSDALLTHARQRRRGFARFDFRGHGQSSGDVGVVTVSELIEDAAAVLHHVGPAILVGSSLGGMVASWTAAFNPDLVKGLVLLSPAFGYLSRMANHPVHEEMVLVTSTQKEVRLHNRVLDDAARFDEANLPQRLTMPVLLVHGERDSTVPPAVSRRCFERIPHERKTLWIIPGEDHQLDTPIVEVFEKMDDLLG